MFTFIFTLIGLVLIAVGVTLSMKKGSFKYAAISPKE